MNLYISFFFAIATNKRYKDISLDDHYYYLNKKIHPCTNNKKKNQTKYKNKQTQIKAHTNQIKPKKQYMHSRLTFY